MIAGQETVLVVVDCLAGSAQESCRLVPLVAKDQVRVSLAALQRDAHGHLAHRAAGERIRTAQRL